MRLSRRHFLRLVPASVLFAGEGVRAAVYFSTEDVKAALFPEATRFVDQSLMLSRAQMKAIGKASETRVKFPKVRVFEAYQDAQLLGRLFVDKVIGKHEYITYALAVDSAGAIANVEVMEYRESYGGQIRNAKWRQQFVGRRHGDAVRINKDIKNVSGATLSCSHITEGVRRLLTTHALYFS